MQMPEAEQNSSECAGYRDFADRSDLSILRLSILQRQDPVRLLRRQGLLNHRVEFLQPPAAVDFVKPDLVVQNRPIDSNHDP